MWQVFRMSSVTLHFSPLLRFTDMVSRAGLIRRGVWLRRGSGGPVLLEGRVARHSGAPLLLRCCWLFQWEIFTLSGGGMFGLLH